VVGDRGALDWFLAEGETDACRLFDLVGDVAAVMLLPAGARTFKPDWANRIPRGATAHLCHDADADGDEGAAKVAQALGGRTVRVRPPDEAKDWCEWEGGRDEFVALVAAARATKSQYEFVALGDFLQHPFPPAEPLLGESGQIYLAVGSSCSSTALRAQRRARGRSTGSPTWPPAGPGSASRCRGLSASA
jgi:hypothetical protein